MHRKRNKRQMTDNVTGNITLTDSCTKKLLYRAIGVNTSLTIKVNNTSNATMRLVIKREGNETETVEVLPNSDNVVTVTSIHSIKVKCCGLGEGETCRGNFTLFIHYPYGESIEENATENVSNQNDSEACWYCEDNCDLW